MKNAIIPVFIFIPPSLLSDAGFRCLGDPWESLLD
jgi:hypothetical protein